MLVDEGAGVGEDAVVELGVIPGHDEGAGGAGAAADGGAAVGIVGELDVGLGFDERQDFVLDELGVLAGHGVVLEAALAALGVAAAVADGDGDHGGKLVRGDECVERGEEQRSGPSAPTMNGAIGAGDVCLGT